MRSQAHLGWVLSYSCTHYILHAHVPEHVVSLSYKRTWMEPGKLRTLWEATFTTLTQGGHHCSL